MYATLSFVLFAATTVFGAVLKRGGEPSCNAAAAQCCREIQTPDNEDYADTTKYISIPVEGFAIPVGVDCMPIPIVGADVGQDCQDVTTCCDYVTHDFVGVNCVPLNFNI